MDQPVVRLAGEVPEHRLALGPIAPRVLQLVEHPELLAVRRGCSLNSPCASRHPSPVLPTPVSPTRTIFALV